MHQTTTPIPIGTRIRRIREEQGIPQAELARRLGISRQSLRSVEARPQQRMNPAGRLRYATALGVDPDRLADQPPSLEDVLAGGYGLRPDQIERIRRHVRRLASTL